MTDSPQNDVEPICLIEDADSGSRFLIYDTPQGVRLELEYLGDTFWMTQEQMASLFGVDRSGIARHLKNIFTERELDEASVCAKNARTAADGKTYEVQHYNLDAIISVGYRVSSKQGTLFRKWATSVLVQLANKGFVVDVKRLKDPAEYDRIKELRELVRDIRSSERNLYAELRRICSMCQDYDSKSDAARIFYQTTQAKLFWAVVAHTPSMIIAERANAALPDMGLQIWPQDKIRKQDAKVAKNYLAPGEIEELNRLTEILLSIFEDQLAIGKLTLMSEASSLLDAQLKGLSRPVLTHGGSISHAEAERVAETEYAKFDQIRRQYRVNETNEELARLREATSELPARPPKGKPQ